MPCASLHKTSVLNTSKNNDKGNRAKSSDVILVSVHNFVQLCTNFEHVFFCLKRARSLQKIHVRRLKENLKNHSQFTIEK